MMPDKSEMLSLLRTMQRIRQFEHRLGEVLRLQRVLRQDHEPGRRASGPRRC